MQQFSAQQRSSYYSGPTEGVRAQQDPDQTGHGYQTSIGISSVQKDGPPNHWQEMLWVWCKTWLITSPVCSTELCALFLTIWYYETSLQVGLYNYMFDYPDHISACAIKFQELLVIHTCNIKENLTHTNTHINCCHAELSSTSWLRFVEFLVNL